MLLYCDPEWDEFRRLKAENYLALMRSPNIVDARKLYRPEDFKETNFEAVGLGPMPSSQG